MTTKKPVEKTLVVKVELKRLVREEWNSVMQVPEEVLLFGARFYAAWMSFPPLVRSATTMAVLKWLRDAEPNYTRAMEVASSHGLTRRIAVYRSFREAHVELGRLMATLTRAADKDAEERGIDGDLTP